MRRGEVGWLAVGLFMLALGAVALQGAVTGIPAALTATVAPSRTPRFTVTPTPRPGIGYTVHIGTTVWNMFGVEDHGQQLTGFRNRSTSGRFLRVGYVILTQTKRGQEFSYPSLVDDEGRQYDPITDGHYWISDDEDCRNTTLNPDVARACTAIYEVADDATGLVAIVRDLSGGRQRVEIDLGLENNQ
jgi:hypothetical protein